MSANSKANLFAPLLIFVLFLTDGVLAAFFSAQFFGGAGAMSPRLIVIGLVLMSMYIPRNKMMAYAILFGLLYDSYYVGILGPYAALFAITVFITEKVKKILNPNPIVIGMMVVINLSLVEVFLYTFYNVLGFTAIDTTTFMADKLGPTLLLNLVLFIFAFYPLKKIIETVVE